MIHLSMHTDNWRPLSGSFQTAVETAVKYRLTHIEFGTIHGQYFVNGLGYEPSVSLSSNPRRLRKYLDAKGLEVSQIDAAFPLLGPEGSTFGVQYIQQAIRFAAEIGCPRRRHDRRSLQDRRLQRRRSLPHHVRKLSPVPVVGGRLRGNDQYRDARTLHHQRRFSPATFRPFPVATTWVSTSTRATPTFREMIRCTT